MRREADERTFTRTQTHMHISVSVCACVYAPPVLCELLNEAVPLQKLAVARTSGMQHTQLHSSSTGNSQQRQQQQQPSGQDRTATALLALSALSVSMASANGKARPSAAATVAVATIGASVYGALVASALARSNRRNRRIYTQLIYVNWQCDRFIAATYKLLQVLFCDIISDELRCAGARQVWGAHAQPFGPQI